MNSIHQRIKKYKLMTCFYEIESTMANLKDAAIATIKYSGYPTQGHDFAMHLRTIDFAKKLFERIVESDDDAKETKYRFDVVNKYIHKYCDYPYIESTIHLSNVSNVSFSTVLAM